MKFTCFWLLYHSVEYHFNWLQFVLFHFNLLLFFFLLFYFFCLWATIPVYFVRGKPTGTVLNCNFMYAIEEVQSARFLEPCALFVLFYGRNTKYTVRLVTKIVFGLYSYMLLLFFFLIFGLVFKYIAKFSLNMIAGYIICICGLKNIIWGSHNLKIFNVKVSWSFMHEQW